MCANKQQRIRHQSKNIFKNKVSPRADSKFKCTTIFFVWIFFFFFYILTFHLTHEKTKCCFQKIKPNQTKREKEWRTNIWAKESKKLNLNYESIYTIRICVVNENCNNREILGSLLIECHTRLEIEPLQSSWVEFWFIWALDHALKGAI